MTEGGPPFLPYGCQTVEEDDIAAVAEALRSGWLTTGPLVGRFEAEFAKTVQAPHAVVCANGTAALHLAMMALGIGPGDAVCVPALTFLATANCATYVGAEVAFADVDAATGLMTPESFRAVLDGPRGARVRAVIPVHLNGQAADMAGIAALARQRGIRVVEDACHALGTEGIGACSHSDMAVFSLHAVKTITAGEGGVVSTRDPALAEALARLRSHGMVRDAARFESAELAMAADGGANPWYYEMPEPGFNYRLPDINCALALSQLGKLDRFLARRADLVGRYDTLLAPLAPKLLPMARAGGSGAVGWHLYAARFDFDAIGHDRAAVMKALAGRGIGTQVHYLPVHLQPWYRKRNPDLALPGALAYYRHCLSLPLFPSLTDADQDRVVAALAEVLA
ncbi:UDP-4-amino-4,6-dideoxy-N-acetyl-beta-L-altrosamine transaminase [Magnetospirillum sp. UT-4]|uniref:UDP-4-amino-4, 6-dideoxy-N-acetyl-beta-L-altrosamine transaminase n=1 Tax=Magnetospirillum sp. UT-4 TaxID=2681467 RepID=UPI00137F1E08|nr:UDP-4-amino-4,6-dideoxy-N-acetyl-beta-L-altrosamine transaminase [Magnetospirillum sp. UT-4]CAA7618667.1 UDP-4-amino-4-deoxy-L-arabinose--oxoglutarate aminotransferase [Magnetospirillum sp. UT-4]